MDKVQCPYDKNHFIRPSRLAVHLNKCKINHPDSNLVNCAFNSLHVLPKKELRNHYKVCPSRINNERIMNRPANQIASFIPRTHQASDRGDFPAAKSNVGEGSSVSDLTQSRIEIKSSGRGLTHGTLRSGMAINECERKLNAWRISSSPSPAPTLCTRRCNRSVPALEPSFVETRSEQENWDDSDAPTYNPLEHVEQNAIIRESVGLRPAERKQFRRDERRRLKELKGKQAK